MMTNEQKKLARKAERIALNSKRPVLTPEEQLDVFARARLVLRLKSPENPFDKEERTALRTHQVKQIEQFVTCLEENAVNEFGRILVAIYSVCD